MKVFKKRFFAVILLALAVSIAVSCADNDGGGSQRNDGNQVNGAGADPESPLQTDSEADELVLPTFPDRDFEGYNFRILSTGEGWIGVMRTLVVEEETGEVLNDAIFRRNRLIEDRFGFNLIHIPAAGVGDVRNRGRISIQAGSDDFDLLMTSAGNALELAQGGFLAMIDEIPIIDLTKPWWDQDMKRDFSIGNRVYFICSDFTFNHYSATVPIFFNKQLHADLGLDCPYQLVREGRWTIDRFAEMGRAALRDLNGDGIFDLNDQFGLISDTRMHVLSFFAGSNTRFVRKDRYDMPYSVMNNDRFINVFNRIFETFREDWVYDPTIRGGGENQENIFIRNQTLFWCVQMNFAVLLRDMESDFGILPIPKWDESQEYHISSTGQIDVKCIPITTSDFERTGLILEALSVESFLTTRAVYYDTMLRSRLFGRDEESGEMLDIIFANRIYETGRHYWGNAMSNPIINLVTEGNPNIVSELEAREGAIYAVIAETVAMFLD